MLIQIDDFLSDADCAIVCKTYDSRSKTAELRDYCGNPMVYWREFSDLPASFLVRRVAETARQILSTTTSATLFIETIMLCRLGQGGMHPLHADNCMQDSKGNWVQNHTPDRKVSCILYLGQEFTGGQIRFANQNKTIVPRTGLLIAFPSDKHYAHEVFPVQSGFRYTVAIFLTDIEGNSLQDFRLS